MARNRNGEGGKPLFGIRTDSETWQMFKAMAIENELNYGDMFAKMVKEYRPSWERRFIRERRFI